MLNYNARKLISLSTLSLIAALAGCAGPSVKPDFVLDRKGATALAIVSVTRPDEQVFFMSPVCSYRSMDRKTRGTIGISRIPRTDEDRIESSTVKHLGRPSVMGKLVALELPPGEYEFDSCSVSSAFTSYYTPKPVSLRFHLAPGEIVYLGNIHASPSDKPFLRVLNNDSRDLSLAKERWPNVPIHETQRRLLSE